LSTFKIGYFADGPWSHRAFDKIIAEKDIEICFICPRSDTQDETLKNYSHEHKIDYLINSNINKPEFIDKLQSYQLDLLVSMSFNQIFKKDILSIFSNKVINCHAGKLPFYRGRNILNWVLINDEKEYGITVHYIDEGIDTGNIILQKTYPISDEDNYSTLLENSYEECGVLLLNAIKNIKGHVHESLDQESIHPVGMYCGKREIGDEIINWNQNSRDLFNFIRSICFPGPKAQSYIDNNCVKINKARFLVNAPNYKGTPGQILMKKGDSYFVKTIDSMIEIYEIESNVKIRVGDRFKSKIP
jgi:methionyl-tRNA formyltransferase